MTRNSISVLSMISLIIVLLSACKGPKSLNYFSQDSRDSSHNRIWQNYEVKIQSGDRLAIYVTALNAASAQPYNLSSGTGTAVLAQGQGLTVDQQGKILYPQLGFIDVAGLTKDELRDTLLNRLKIYLIDPVVTVDFMNLKITVLGEVAHQGSFPITNGTITLLQAIGEAGDITSTGMRDSILVIRENNGRREFGYVNLLSNQAFKSPYFALQQNDVIYVPMNAKKVRSEQDQVFSKNLQVVTSVVTVLSTIGLLILNLTR